MYFYQFFFFFLKAMAPHIPRSSIQCLTNHFITQYQPSLLSLEIECGTSTLKTENPHSVSWNYFCICFVQYNNNRCQKVSYDHLLLNQYLCNEFFFPYTSRTTTGLWVSTIRWIKNILIFINYRSVVIIVWLVSSIQIQSYIVWFQFKISILNSEKSVLICVNKIYK